MARIGSITISPVLMNTACVWASNLEQLQALHSSSFTGAVTTRTCTLKGYNETSTCGVVFTNSSMSSLNTYGYSPLPLASYIGWVKEILSTAVASSNGKPVKPFIISITACSVEELSRMIFLVQELRSTPMFAPLVAVELNTSCPNVSSPSPSGYIPSSIYPLLRVLSEAHMQDKSMTIGLKLPPYTFRGQFHAMISTLKEFNYEDANGGQRNSFAFLTCTNTLGNSLLFPDQIIEPLATARDTEFAVPTTVGGLAGDAIHALSVGNVYTFHRLLHEENQSRDGLYGISIIGVGGVTTPAALGRMHKAGASVVGVATLLGAKGVRAFELLSN
ncbi:hypothetical protein J3R30DRAFT_3669610 [Lentinula aciculospora]|uniref:Dihydroorotate dehydrogenase catalytic domain-containing protein n=1 Tax=Lentinula aciculospora TaxID=153920 RepID=A0A9W9DRD2_9AGAR|nr:hypothetical protein J3R30DRAFT_3669610 [Lentinula aciculospora]